MCRHCIAIMNLSFSFRKILRKQGQCEAAFLASESLLQDIRTSITKYDTATVYLLGISALSTNLKRWYVMLGLYPVSVNQVIDMINLDLMMNMSRNWSVIRIAKDLSTNRNELLKAQSTRWSSLHRTRSRFSILKTLDRGGI